MKSYVYENIYNSLNAARIYADAEFEKLCTNRQYVDACVLQSIRDSIAQNMQILKSYVFSTELDTDIVYCDTDSIKGLTEEVSR